MTVFFYDVQCTTPILEVFLMMCTHIRSVFNDVAVVAQSFMDKCGAAVAVGEQPLKAVGGTLEDYRRMARLYAGRAPILEVFLMMCTVHPYYKCFL